MKVAFRVDASLQIGSGHVMRCLTLAGALREKGCQCYFLCREHPGNLIALIRTKGYGVYVLPMDETHTAHNNTPHAAWLGTTQDADAHISGMFLEKCRPTWLIVDHYALDAFWERQMRAFCQYLMIIDDLADRRHACHILMDQNWYGADNQHRYQSLLDDDTQQLLGPQYALLGPEYRQERLHLPTRSGHVRQILVFMGGSDPDNVTQRILTALSTLSLQGVKIKTVVGINYPYYENLSDAFRAEDGWEILRGMPTLAALMRESDLMIGAGGSTNWERMCLGLPSVILSIAKNQVEICEWLARDGYITYLGKSDEVTADMICNKISGLISQSDLLAKQSLKMMGMVDGLGIERACHTLLEEYKK